MGTGSVAMDLPAQASMGILQAGGFQKHTSLFSELWELAEGMTAWVAFWWRLSSQVLEAAFPPVPTGFFCLSALVSLLYVLTAVFLI